METLVEKTGALAARMMVALAEARRRARELAAEESAQGTTEYAILVGVLVVIAILAIVAFKGKVQELWTAIQDGMAKL